MGRPLWVAGTPPSWAAALPEGHWIVSLEDSHCGEHPAAFHKAGNGGGSRTQRTPVWKQAAGPAQRAMAGSPVKGVEMASSSLIFQALWVGRIPTLDDAGSGCEF